MSSLSFCSLDQAFNDASSDNKKEKKKKKFKNDTLNPLSRTFVNNIDLLIDVEIPSIDMMPNPPTPEYATVTQVQRSTEPPPVPRDIPRDMTPNNLQNSLNNESIQLFKNMQEQILVLTNELNNIKNSSNSSLKMKGNQLLKVLIVNLLL